MRVRQAPTGPAHRLHSVLRHVAPVVHDRLVMVAENAKRAILDQAQVERVGLVVSGVRAAAGGYEYYGGVDTETTDKASAGRRG